MDANPVTADRALVDYAEAQRAQRRLVGWRHRGQVPDILWLLEHPPTVTFGSSGGASHLLCSPRELGERGIAFVRSERGGDITFHEPGQLVGYPIVDWGGPGDRDLYVYLRRLEEGILSYLASAGLACVRVPGKTGVWIEGAPPRKIAAIGVRAARWITSHGFALNVCNDLQGFGLIVPCGIRDAGVTSMALELRKGLPAWVGVCSGMHGALESSLGRRLLLVKGPEGLSLAP
jgi:lipoyl(octanoyl) transferase